LAKPTTVTTISSPKSTPTAEPSTVSTIQTTTTTKATATPLPILFSCSVSDPAGNEHDSIAVTNLRLKRLSELKFFSFQLNHESDRLYKSIGGRLKTAELCAAT
jgi:hypothetical protein